MKHEETVRRAEMVKISLKNGTMKLVKRICGVTGEQIADADDEDIQVVNEGLDALLKMAAHSDSDSVVPESRELKKDLSHVDMICKAFINDHEWYDGTNMYAPRCSVYAVLPYGENAKWNYAFSGTSYKESKKLFMPTDAEIQSALDEFKKKGWHAQYDPDCGYYTVFEGTRALGEYQARFTRNLF